MTLAAHLQNLRAGYLKQNNIPQIPEKLINCLTNDTCIFCFCLSVRIRTYTYHFLLNSSSLGRNRYETIKYLLKILWQLKGATHAILYLFFKS